MLEQVEKRLDRKGVAVCKFVGSVTRNREFFKSIKREMIWKQQWGGPDLIS
jgi:hypothetical protein